MAGGLHVEEYYVELIPMINGYPPDPEDMKHEKIMCWVCPGCDRVVDWEFGCGHDDPVEASFCDDCWVERYGSGNRGTDSEHSLAQEGDRRT